MSSPPHSDARTDAGVGGETHGRHEQSTSTEEYTSVWEGIESLRDDKSQLLRLELDHFYDKRDRTFLVSDVVVERFGDDPSDGREYKRSVRVVDTPCHPDIVYALLLTVYPDQHEYEAHCLEAPKAIEEDASYGITDLQVVEPDLEWVIIRQGSDRSRYHRPDPVKISRGTAEPACGYPSSDSPDHRLVTGSTVAGRLYPCKDCFMNRGARPATEVACPDCKEALPDVVLEGCEPDTISSVVANCPSCDFDGVISLV